MFFTLLHMDTLVLALIVKYLLYEIDTVTHVQILNKLFVASSQQTEFDTRSMTQRPIIVEI